MPLRNNQPATDFAGEYLSTFGDMPMQGGMVSAVQGMAASNDAVLLPVKFRRSITIAGLTWLVGTTGATGNYDIGIYDASGARLWSKGSTAWPAPAAKVSETVSPTVVIPAGTVFYIALAGDNTTSQFRGATVPDGQTTLLDGTTWARKANTSFPLPNPIVITGGATRVPLVVIREV